MGDLKRAYLLIIRAAVMVSIMGTGWVVWHLPTLAIILLGIAHPAFLSLEIVWVRTAHSRFFAKPVPYYDNYSHIFIIYSFY